MKKIINFLKDEEGAALPEYALLVALIAVACVIAIGALGTAISAKFDTMKEKIG